VILPRHRALLLTASLLLFSSGASNARAQVVSRTADGFDLPVSPPDAAGFYKSRGFRAGGHLGEDWVTDGGSSRGFGKPVHAAGNGIVVLARDIHVAWGNVVVIRHAWIENRQLRFADSLYAHMDRITVREGQQVVRGQQVGTIGNNHGMYPPHLHFEIHKDLGIGVNHSEGTRDQRSYWVPTDFIMSHRHLAGGGRAVPTPAARFLLPSVSHPWTFRFHQQGHSPGHPQKSHGKTHPPALSKGHSSSHSSPSPEAVSHFRINRYTDP